MAQSPMPPKYPSALVCTSEDNSTHFNVTIKLNDWKFDRKEDYVKTNYDNEALAWNGFWNKGSMMIYIQGQVSPLYSQNNCRFAFKRACFSRWPARRSSGICSAYRPVPATLRRLCHRGQQPILLTAVMA
jgi:hypothetical protein